MWSVWTALKLTKVTISMPSQSLHEVIEQQRQEIEGLRQQLLQSQKMGSIGELASSMTHEFNNILTTIINYSKLGLRQKDDQAREKAFDRILNASQRAAKITTGLLAYSRSSESRRDPHNLSKLVRDVIILVEKDLKVHRIHLDTQYLADPYANVNAGQVQQVLLNLIVNARQAMVAGRTLTIKVSESVDDQYAEISIKDQGSGISPDVLPRIFERFYTTKSADEHGQGGTGLGLSLCREVMEAHGGRIRVETAVGHGTQFSLRFPTVAPPDFSLKSAGKQESSESPTGSPSVAAASLS
ncbi:HAMP domain-containing sensor histidine kinase [Thalassoglobus sp. JC818]|uniref:sensor histidine kinase n=1 Tax=Thalassoglobus sp. JC818 TaxID=3232136 RepID=UPI003457BB41